MANRNNKPDIYRSEQSVLNWSFDENLKTIAILGLSYSPDGSTKMNVTKNLKLIVDEANATTTYIGKAAPSTVTSAASWQIQKIDTTSGVSITFANGSDAFDSVWDNRASLSYS